MAAGLPSAVYDFSVERRNSHWETRIGGQAIFPAYKGSVWIDKKSMRVLRIEMQARSIPEEFPLNTVEWVVNYEFVRLGTRSFCCPSTPRTIVLARLVYLRPQRNQFP